MSQRTPFDTRRSHLRNLSDHRLCPIFKPEIQNPKSKVNHKFQIRTLNRRRHAGLSLVEVLISLAITALLLTATTAALVASFRAYGDAVEQTSTQVAARMVTHRLLSLIRTGTLHGPLTPGDGATLSGQTITSSYLELIDPSGNLIRCEYRDDDQQLWLIQNPGAGEVAQPLLANVTAAQFILRRRLNDNNLFVLERATFDFTIRPDEDATLALENGPSQPLRMISSTMPRRLE